MGSSRHLVLDSPDVNVLNFSYYHHDVQMKVYKMLNLVVAVHILLFSVLSILKSNLHYYNFYHKAANCILANPMYSVFNFMVSIPRLQKQSLKNLLDFCAL